MGGALRKDNASISSGRGVDGVQTLFSSSLEAQKLLLQRMGASRTYHMAGSFLQIFTADIFVAFVFGVFSVAPVGYDVAAIDTFFQSIVGGNVTVLGSVVTVEQSLLVYNRISWYISATVQFLSTGSKI